MKHHSVPHHLLAMAISERSIRFAESKRRGGSVEIVGTSHLELETPVMDTPPQATGSAIAAHVKAQGYKARYAVVGLCTRWMLVQRETAPPVNGQVLAGIVRLKIEKQYSASREQMQFDYQDAPADDGQRGLLLVGAAKDRLGRVKAAVEAAGIVTSAIVASALAAAAALGKDGVVVLLERSGASVMVMDEQQCMDLASFAASLDDIATAEGQSQFVTDLRRTLAMSQGSKLDNQSDILLLDATEQGQAVRKQLCDAIAASFDRCEFREADEAELIARGALREGSSLANLLSLRLESVPRRYIAGYVKRIGQVVAAVVLLLLIVAVFYARAAERVRTLRQAHAAVLPKASQLEELHRDIRAAAGWFDERPAVLDCLLDLTRSFPRRGRIWVTNLKFEDTGRGVIKCKAEDKQLMFECLNAMQTSRRLDAVELRDWNESGRTDRLVVFEIVFRYRSDVGEGSG